MKEIYKNTIKTIGFQNKIIKNFIKKNSKPKTYLKSKPDLKGKTEFKCKPEFKKKS
tara:strand:- start:2342 stop:2509 length:168 start_codon:yes stop_codon:yes gene_type:complete